MNVSSLLYYLYLIEMHLYLYCYPLGKLLSNYLPPPIYNVDAFEKPGDPGGTWAMGLPTMALKLDFTRLSLAWISHLLYLDLGYFPTSPQQLQTPRMLPFSFYREL